MDDNQRGAMYQGWAQGKKWVEIEVKEMEEGSWYANTITSLMQNPIYRDTKAQAIYSITGKLQEMGYEILNLAEIQGIC